MDINWLGRALADGLLGSAVAEPSAASLESPAGFNVELRATARTKCGNAYLEAGEQIGRAELHGPYKQAAVDVLVCWLGKGLCDGSLRGVPMGDAV